MLVVVVEKGGSLLCCCCCSCLFSSAAVCGSGVVLGAVGGNGDLTELARSLGGVVVAVIYSDRGGVIAVIVVDAHCQNGSVGRQGACFLLWRWRRGLHQDVGTCAAVSGDVNDIFATWFGENAVMGGVRFKFYFMGRGFSLPFMSRQLPDTFKVGQHKGTGLKPRFDWDKICQAYQCVNTHMVGYLLSLSFTSFPVNM